MKLSLKLALRFLKSKRYGPLAKLISIASTGGIAMGVGAIIIGLSAMNGFEAELKNRVLSLIPSATVTSVDNMGFTDVDKVAKALLDNQNISSVSKVVTMNVAICENSQFMPSVLMGFDPDEEKKVIAFDRFMDVPASVIRDDPNGIILGYSMADRLGVKKGDEIQVFLTPATSTSQSLAGMINKTFTVKGFFKTGGQLDLNFAFIDLKGALDLAKLRAPNTIHVHMDDMLNVQNIMYRSSTSLPEYVDIKTWIDSHGKLYSDINMIRQIMYLAMILIIAVACFNIISNLIMAVSEKKREIAILMTVGCSKAFIIRTFTLMGILNAVKGCIIGTVAGVVLSLTTPYVTANFKNWFGIELLNADLYFVNYVPSELELMDVLIVTGCAILMSIAASLYPAIRASRTDIAKELSV
ncbi:MAG: FtsX-like permease family protein [Succinivibrio sp.]